MQSGTWEIIADTLYWIQLVWVLSGFVLMAYLAVRVFPWRDETQNAASSMRALPWQNSDDRIERSRARTIVAGNYRFDCNYSGPSDPGKIMDKRAER